MRSILSSIQSYQQGPRTVDATSAHGFGHGVINITRKGFSKVTLSRCVLDVSPLTNLPGAKAPGLSHSNRQAVTSPALCRSRVRVPSLCASGAHTMQRRVCKHVAAQTFRDKPKNQGAISVTVHRSFPFQGRFDREVSHAPKGFGNARKAFGEFRNV